MSKNNDFQKILDSLNQEQKEAVEYIYGSAVVLAGPGSGKTQLLTTRIANILTKTDTLSSSILCLTFTDSAARNLQQRLKKVIGKEAYKVEIFTFHALGSHIINNYPEYFFESIDYNPIDEINQVRILEEILHKYEFNDILSSYNSSHGYTYLNSIMQRVMQIKNQGLTPLEFQDYIQILQTQIKILNPIYIEFSELRSNQVKQNFITDIINRLLEHEGDLILKFRKELEYLRSLDEPKELSKAVQDLRSRWGKIHRGKKCLYEYIELNKLVSLARIYKLYQEKMVQNGLYDYSDMIVEVISTIKNNPDLLMNLQEKYQFVMVDEFQDTSGLQLDFLLSLCKTKNEPNPNVLVVGDDDQAIYKFQGASLKNFEDFRHEFPNSKIINLKYNYRSGLDIIKYSSNLLNHKIGHINLFNIKKVYKHPSESL